METVTIDNISDKEMELLEAAKEASAKAYSPINNIYLGAAVLDESGEITQGANYGVSSALNICAERAAIITASSLGRTQVKQLAIWSSSDNPLSSCGPCRQFIYETGNRSNNDIVILSSNKDFSKITKTTISEMFPHPYKREL